jgi:hypothetical protein
LLIWSLPILVFWILRTPLTFTFNPYLLAIALLSSLVGNLGSLNTICYAGLAFALASFVPYTPWTIFWIAGAISWMPAIGWIGSYYFMAFIYPTRLILAAVAASPLLIHLYRRKQ